MYELHRWTDTDIPSKSASLKDPPPVLLESKAEARFLESSPFFPLLFSSSFGSSPFELSSSSY